MNNLIKIEDLKRPPEIGELFLVPCVVYNLMSTDKKIKLCPVINHPHNDIENGQPETHYHIDYRFVGRSEKYKSFFRQRRSGIEYVFYPAMFRPELNSSFKSLEYFAMRLVTTNQINETSVIAIAKSRLHHQCIHKGKCPHRGYDLSQTVAIDGVITCPLHGLKFDEKTGKVLNHINI